MTFFEITAEHPSWTVDCSNYPCLGQSTGEAEVLVFRPLGICFVVDFNLDLLAFMYDIDTHIFDHFELVLLL